VRTFHLLFHSVDGSTCVGEVGVGTVVVVVVVPWHVAGAHLNI
jgi:hypothetical protein